MKFLKRLTFHILYTSFFLLGFILFIQTLNAQEIKIAQSTSNQSQITPSLTPQSPVQISITKKIEAGIISKIQQATTLTYYHQFLGPTLKGSSNETYNVFQEGLNQPGTGRAPLQSFHAVNLKFKLNNDWAVGTGLAAVNSYTEAVENKGGIVNKPETIFFNLRSYISLPKIKTSIGELFSTWSYEAPTSVISRNDEMQWGLVINESFSFYSGNPSITYGLMAQYYRSYFPHSDNIKKAPFPGGAPTELQTVIISGGPYLNYRFSDKWQIGSLLTFDWDQKGTKTDTTQYNNNLPHRGRIGISYFPNSIKPVTSVGLFTQALLKFRRETSAVGFEFAMSL